MSAGNNWSKNKWISMHEGELLYKLQVHELIQTHSFGNFNSFPNFLCSLPAKTGNQGFSCSTSKCSPLSPLLTWCNSDLRSDMAKAAPVLTRLAELLTFAVIFSHLSNRGLWMCKWGHNYITYLYAVTAFFSMLLRSQRAVGRVLLLYFGFMCSAAVLFLRCHLKKNNEGGNPPL